jgi:hypothetical protein
MRSITEILTFFLRCFIQRQRTRSWEIGGARCGGYERGFVRRTGLEPPNDRARVGELDGRNVILVVTPNASGGETLSSVIWLETSDRLVVRRRWYFWCPEFLRFAADQSGLKAKTHGYRSPV